MLELKKEIISRVSEMEKDDYTFEDKFGTRDFIIVGIVSVASLILIIIGAFL